MGGPTNYDGWRLATWTVVALIGLQTDSFVVLPKRRGSIGQFGSTLPSWHAENEIWYHLLSWKIGMEKGSRWKIGMELG